MSLRGNARWNGQADRLRHSGPGPHGAVSYLSICGVLRGEERSIADQRGLTPSGGDGNYNWLALTLGYGTNQTLLLPRLALPCCWQLRR